MFELLPNWFNVKIFFQPSSSKLDGPTGPLVLSIVFFTFSASIKWNLIGWVSSGISGSNASESASLPCGCFYFIWFKVWSFNERIPSSSIPSHYWFTPAHFTSKLFRYLRMVDGVLDILKSFWVVSISFTNSMISSTCHSSIWFSNDLKWFFDFDFREGFCQRRRSSTIIALNAIFFSGDSCIQSIINLEISSMKFFSTCPDGNKNRFFLQYTIYS